MFQGIKITPAELMNAAEEMKKEVNQMQGILNDTTVTVKSTTESWQATAADNLRSRYEGLASKFQDFYDAINNYAAFLEKTASSYVAADKKIEERANELLNNGYNV